MTGKPYVLMGTSMVSSLNQSIDIETYGNQEWNYVETKWKIGSTHKNGGSKRSLIQKQTEGVSC